MYAKVLVPLDGSARGESILPHIAELASRLGSEVVLLRVVKSASRAQRETRPTMVAGTSPTMVDIGFETAQGMTSSEHDAARAYMARAAAVLRERGITVRSAVAEGGEAGAIAQYAKQHGIDLIVLTGHRRGGLSRFIRGSFAEELSRSAACPILLLPAR